jgi:hypothetical protein
LFARFVRCLCIGSVFLFFGAGTFAHAQDDRTRSASQSGPDTEHMFGFTEGSDIGHRGDLEAEVETIGRFGRQANSYSTISTTPTLKYGVTDQFRIAPAVTLSNYSVSGLTGSNDNSRFSFEAVSLELRYHPLDRHSAPVGVTFVATPSYGFTNVATGIPADRFGAEFIAVADRELIPGQLFVALNLAYQLERTRDQSSGVTLDGSILRFNAAVSRRVMPWLYVGGEARYLRTFNGLGLNDLAGQAVYLGPVFYVPLSVGISLSRVHGTCRRGDRLLRPVAASI